MDPNWKLHRRSMLSGAASLLVAGHAPALGLSASTSHSRKATTSTRAIRKLRVEEFMELSRFITERSELDPKTGELILESLSQDPRHGDQLLSLYQAVHDAVATGHTSASDFLLRHNATRETFHEVARCWYLGTRWVDGKPVFFTYFDALMFRAVDGMRNIPATCGGALNYWGEPPQI